MLVLLGFPALYLRQAGERGSLLGLIGPLLLGVAVIPAKVFPSLVGITLMVAGVLSHVITLSSGMLISLTGLVGIVCAAIEYGRSGLNLTTQHNVRGAEVPSSVQTVLSL